MLKLSSPMAVLVLACTASLALTACSSDDGPAPTPQEPSFSATAQPHWAIDLSGHEEKPTWQRPPSNSYETSMVVFGTIPQAFRHLASEDDLLGAFVGNECRGWSDAIEDEDGVFLSLYIAGNPGDDYVTLKYYCHKLHRIFSLPNAMPFISDAAYGLDEEYQLPLHLGTGYNCVDTLQVTVPESVAATIGTNDEVAAFVGDECRSLLLDRDDRQWKLLRFRHSADEATTCRYYSEAHGGYTTLP